MLCRLMWGDQLNIIEYTGFSWRRPPPGCLMSVWNGPIRPIPQKNTVKSGTCHGRLRKVNMLENQLGFRFVMATTRSDKFYISYNSLYTCQKSPRIITLALNGTAGVNGLIPRNSLQKNKHATKTCSICFFLLKTCSRPLQPAPTETSGFFQVSRCA